MPRATAPARMAGAILLGLALAGCAAGATAVAKRQLDVQTRMTDTVFLDPVAPEERTVYVDVRNTSDRPELDIAPQVREAIAARGYRWSTTRVMRTSSCRPTCCRPGEVARAPPEPAYDSGFGGTLLGRCGRRCRRLRTGRRRHRRERHGGRDRRRAGGRGAGRPRRRLRPGHQLHHRHRRAGVRADDGRPGRAPDPAGDLAQGSSGTLGQSSSGSSDLRRYRTRVVSTRRAGQPGMAGCRAGTGGRLEPQHRWDLLSGLRRGSAIRAAATRRSSASSTL